LDRRRDPPARPRRRRRVLLGGLPRVPQRHLGPDRPRAGRRRLRRGRRAVPRAPVPRTAPAGAVRGRPPASRPPDHPPAPPPRRRRRPPPRVIAVSGDVPDTKLSETSPNPRSSEAVVPTVGLDSSTGRVIVPLSTGGCALSAGGPPGGEGAPHARS